MNATDNKAAFRKEAFAHMRKKDPYTIAGSKRVMAAIQTLISKHRPQSVLFYYPMDHEMDLRPLMRKLRRQGLAVYLPFMVGDSFKMVGYRLPLRKAKYGIIEPKNSFVIKNSVDMIIVPIVGVDRHFKRIGFGKGMYDRFVERLDPKPLNIFVQSTLCYSHSVITDSHDIRADYIVTPKDFLKIKLKRHDRRYISRRCSSYC